MKKVENMENLPWSEEHRRKLTALCEKGDRLVVRHEKPFEMKVFYTVDDVVSTVENICTCLRETIQVSGLKSPISIQNEVPQDSMDKDKEYLQNMLCYIIQGKGSPPKDPRTLSEWNHAKHVHEESMTDLLIEDKEITISRCRSRRGSSTVWEARYKDAPVAVKCTNGFGQEPIEALAEFLKEVYIQASLVHVHVTKLYKFTTSGKMVMELATKDLKGLCQEEKAMAWPLKLNLVQQAAEGLAYMHSLDPPLVHCDVKTANFLVFGSKPEEYQIKIADFGSTRDTQMSKSVRRPSITMQFVAPEYFHDEILTEAADVYSFGMVICDVLFGELPNLNEKEAFLLKKFTRNKSFKVGMSYCPDELVALLSKCWSHKPGDRPTMKAVCNHLFQLKNIPMDEVSAFIVALLCLILRLHEISFSAMRHIRISKPDICM